MNLPHDSSFMWQLTVGEYTQLMKSLMSEKRYEYGIQGLANLLGCSRSKAYNIKATGILDPAISQNGKIIVIDCDLALKLLSGSEKTPKAFLPPTPPAPNA